jgi:hypothetical protein
MKNKAMKNRLSTQNRARKPAQTPKGDRLSKTTFRPSLFLAATFLLAGVLSSAAESPPLLQYQGRITANGVNFDGEGLFKFALVDGVSGQTHWSNSDGSLNGSEPHNEVVIPVSEGLFSVVLGDVSIPNMVHAIPAEVFTNSDVRLRIWFSDGVTGFERLTPDQRMTSVGYAMTAERAGYAAVAGRAEVVTLNTDIEAARLNVGFENTLNGFLSSIGGGKNNSVSYTSMATIGGGQNNSILNMGSFASIGGGQGNEITSYHAVIAGGAFNLASGAGAFIGGGGTDGSGQNLGNIASGTASVVAGGQRNEATNESAVIGGGSRNVAGYAAAVAGGSQNHATGGYASIGGGVMNRATANYSSVGGGDRNAAEGQFSTVAGGRNNSSPSAYATVAGGASNIASGVGAFVGGGGILYSNSSAEANIALGNASTVAGGAGNLAEKLADTVAGGRGNRASGEYSFVGGGSSNRALSPGASVVGGGWSGSARPNTAEGISSTVAGGIRNHSTGDFSFIAGGSDNEAIGSNSFAGGRKAVAQEGSFVWSDGTAAAYGDKFGRWSKSNQFLIHASGGVGINTARVPDGGLVINDDTFINKHDLFLKEEDRSVGLGWYGPGKLLDTGGSVAIDGPVLYGKTGALAGIHSGDSPYRVAMTWNKDGVQTHQPLTIGSGATINEYLNLNCTLALNRDDILLRDRLDVHNGLGWYGPGKPFGDFHLMDGPVLYGFQTGALGVARHGNRSLALKWDSSAVTAMNDLKVMNNLSVQNDLNVKETVTAQFLHLSGDWDLEELTLRVSGAGLIEGSLEIHGGLAVLGLKLFVEPHPNDDTKEIAYVALEGPEAAIFLRGTARVMEGEVTIVLPEHFSLVTMDEGVTVQLTPRGQYLQLFVAESDARQIVVREAQGKTGDFDYLVQGVRRGYEDHEPVRPRRVARVAP